MSSIYILIIDIHKKNVFVQIKPIPFCIKYNDSNYIIHVMQEVQSELCKSR